ncbi:MAG: histidine phosphatase family protein [Nanobdellota archaeon]
MRIVLVRHGETNYNVLGLCSEKPGYNVYLTTRGELQVKRIALQLKPYSFDSVYVSDLFRTQQTAHIINEHHHVPLSVDSRLNDRYTGFDSRPIREFRESISQDPFHKKPVEGESFQEVKARVRSFIEDLKKRTHHTVLIVTHSCIIRVFYLIVNNLPDTEVSSIEVANASVYEFEL